MGIPVKLARMGIISQSRALVLTVVRIDRHVMGPRALNAQKASILVMREFASCVRYLDFYATQMAEFYENRDIVFKISCVFKNVTQDLSIPLSTTYVLADRKTVFAVISSTG
jgi:hypothetical protein